MKKLFSVLVALLAINFFAVAGATVWIVKTQHVNREKLMAIKDVLYPKETAPATQPAARRNVAAPTSLLLTISRKRRFDLETPPPPHV